MFFNGFIEGFSNIVKYSSPAEQSGFSRCTQATICWKRGRLQHFIYVT